MAVSQTEPASTAFTYSYKCHHILQQVAIVAVYNISSHVALS